MIKLGMDLAFPPLSAAEESGFLAFGGDLSISRLLLAYRSGIFPWYSEGEPILWWAPNPRFVLEPRHLVIGKTLTKLRAQKKYIYTCNSVFDQVIHACAEAKRNNQSGTWIHQEMLEAYQNLHEAGHAHSVEVWDSGVLIGGFYGVRMGKVFFGESMFSHQPQASRLALIWYLEQEKEISMVDCQVYTSHLAQLGAQMIPLESLLDVLRIG